MVVVEYEQLHCLKKKKKKNYCLLFYTVILKQLLDMNELNKNIYGLKILTILETLKIYKLMLFTTRDLKKLNLMKMSFMMVQLILGKIYEKVCSPDLLFVANDVMILF